MYAPQHATATPDRPCFIMAETSETVTYSQFEARSNRLAHLLRAHGLRHRDHYSVFMENNSRFLETCGAGERAGLHYTCINSHLTADEVAYLVNNSDSTALITSRSRRDVALEALRSCPRVTLALMVDASADDAPFVDFDTAVAAQPATPLDDERLGVPMLYSSGTTGQPKGILRDLPVRVPAEPLELNEFLTELWRYRSGMIYLSPAPLYHSAPLAAVGLTIRAGGTAIVMERFDPERYLALVEHYGVTHSQLVPTMFSRLLKLPDDLRAKYDLSSLEAVVHSAAPCPIPVKEDMIEWWGPIILEYYAATEAIGLTFCDSYEWLAHKGTVGRARVGTVRIMDDDMEDCAPNQAGTIWFETRTPVHYFNDAEKSREATSPDGTMSTVGDIGYLDGEGYLYLTDRKTFMIISGGVNIYPQESENVLITHPKVADAAVFGVPDRDLGEQVKAVVQLMPGIASGIEIEAELLAFCRAHLAGQKCPRTIDFEDSLPRLPTGKLYKRVLRDRYWAAQDRQI